MKVSLIGEKAFYRNGARNKAGDEGFHMQSKAENDKHVSALKQEYIDRHPVKLSSNAAVTARRMAQQEQRANEYAVKNEPKRFLPFLARKTNGIAGDKELRRVNGVQGDPHSSWIKSVSTTANGAPIIVETKSGKKYACPCPWQTAEEILKSDSVGASVGARLFTGTFKMGKGKTQGKIVNKVNGRIAKIRGL